MAPIGWMMNFSSVIPQSPKSHVSKKSQFVYMNWKW